MPTISIFYGITVKMYYFDIGQHNIPHIHVEYSGYEAPVSIETGELLAGDFPNKKLKLVQAWIEIHREDLQANWELASSGETVHSIEPLK